MIRGFALPEPNKVLVRLRDLLVPAPRFPCTFKYGGGLAFLHPIYQQLYVFPQNMSAPAPASTELPAPAAANTAPTASPPTGYTVEIKPHFRGAVRAVRHAHS